jgi:arylsulfatase A-like enzyme
MAQTATTKRDQPNILVIFGDDIGMWNVGVYTHGMMGHTPNIDRIDRDGMVFTDHYGQPSSTAGRAAFIMGSVADPDRHDHHRPAPPVTGRRSLLRPQAEGDGGKRSALQSTQPCCRPALIRSQWI